MDKDQRILKEEARLKKIYKNIDGKKKSTVQGLIQRASFIRVTLEDFEADLDSNGFTEPFSQGNQVPYDRKRPIAELYNSMNTNYLKIIKQLTDLLPKDKQIEPDDGFDDFVNSRNDV